MAPSPHIEPRVSFISGGGSARPSEELQHSPGGPGSWGLSLAFALHSSTSHTVTRALEKRLLQPEHLRQKQMVHKLLGEMHPTLAPREAHYQSGLEMSVDFLSFLKF